MNISSPRKDALHRIQNQAIEKLGTTDLSLDWFDWVINIDYFSQPGGSGLLELFPVDCSCKHPGRYSGHVYACLNWEEIEEFEIKFCALIEKERIAVERYKIEVIQELEEEAREAMEIISEDWNRYCINRDLDFSKNAILRSKNKKAIDQRVEFFLNNFDRIIDRDPQRKTSSAHSSSSSSSSSTYFSTNSTSNFTPSSPNSNSESHSSTNHHTDNYSSYSSDSSNYSSASSFSSVASADSNAPTASQDSESQTTNSSSNFSSQEENNSLTSEEKPNLNNNNNPTSPNLPIKDKEITLTSTDSSSELSPEANNKPLISASEKNFLEEKKQQIIEQIQEQLNQLPNLNLKDEFSDWKQEIMQSQSLAAITAYQKSLQEKIEKQKSLSQPKSIVVDSVKENRDNKFVVLAIGIGSLLLASVLIGYLFWKKKDK